MPSNLALLEKLVLQGDAYKGLVDLQFPRAATLLDRSQFYEYVHEQTRDLVVPIISSISCDTSGGSSRAKKWRSEKKALRIAVLFNTLRRVPLRTPALHR